MKIHTGPWIVLLLLTGFVSSAQAQVIEAQPRPAGRRSGAPSTPDPNRSAQELLLTLSLSGGYDNNLIPTEFVLPVDQYTFLDEGYASAAAGSVVYRVGTSTRNIEGRGQGYVRRGATIVGLPAGGDASITGTTSIGRRMGVNVGGVVSYEPTSLSTTFGALGTPVDEAMPDVSPIQAITPQRWLSVNGSAGFYRNWTSRQRMHLQYSGGRRRPDTGPRQDTRLQSAALGYVWDPRQNAGFQLSYRFNEHRSDLLNADQPVRTQAVDVGIRLDRRLSPTRRMGFTFGGGAARTWSQAQALEGIPRREFTLPTAFGSARVNIIRQWNLSFDLRRDVSVLDGIAPEPFATIATGVRLEGEVGSRLQLAISWASTKGDTQSGSASAFNTATGTAQIQYAFSRFGGLFVGYTYYEHQQEGSLPTLTALPRSYNRNSVRLGLTLWLPVVGGS